MTTGARATSHGIVALKLMDAHHDMGEELPDKAMEAIEQQLIGPPRPVSNSRRSLSFFHSLAKYRRVDGCNNHGSPDEQAALLR